MIFNWLEIFAQGAGITKAGLAGLIQKGGEATGHEDAAAKAIALLEANVEAGHLADVALMIPAELKDIFALKFNPREHPSDGIG